jgi:hypothetical protein
MLDTSRDSGPLRLLLRIVLRLGGPKPEQRQGCCGVAVPGVESGERLALATERTTPAVGLSSGIATIGLLIILYVFSDFARSQGQKIEPRIYKLQGGKPSVTMMRRDDTALDTDSKDRYRAFLASKLVRHGTDRRGGEAKPSRRRIRVGPGIFGIRDQPIDRPPLDLVRRPRSLIFGLDSRAGARAPRDGGSVGAFSRRSTRSRPRSASRH